MSAELSESGATVSVEVVDTVNTDGTLSPRRAEVDYQRGLLRFEAPPLDGEGTTITAQWRIALQSKRLDTLVRLTLDNAGIMDRIGVTPESLRGFSIEKTPIIAQSNAFSSHGRPFAQSVGVARWMVPGTDGIFFAIDNALVKYDEALDEYEEVAQVPDDTSIEEAPPGGYGERIDDDIITFDVNTATRAFAFYRDSIYVESRASGETINVYDLNGNGIQEDFVDFEGLGNGSYVPSNHTYNDDHGIIDFDFSGDKLYVLASYSSRFSGSNVIWREVIIYDVSGSAAVFESRHHNNTILSSGLHFMTVTPDRIIITRLIRV